MLANYTRDRRLTLSTLNLEHTVVIASSKCRDKLDRALAVIPPKVQ